MDQSSPFSRSEGSGFTAVNLPRRAALPATRDQEPSDQPVDSSQESQLAVVDAAAAAILSNIPSVTRPPLTETREAEPTNQPPRPRLWRPLPRVPEDWIDTLDDDQILLIGRTTINAAGDLWAGEPNMLQSELLGAWAWALHFHPRNDAAGDSLRRLGRLLKLQDRLFDRLSKVYGFEMLPGVDLHSAFQAITSDERSDFKIQFNSMWSTLQALADQRPPKISRPTPEHHRHAIGKALGLPVNKLRFYSWKENELQEGPMNKDW